MKASAFGEWIASGRGDPTLRDLIEPDGIADMHRFVGTQVLFSRGRSHEQNAPGTGRIEPAIHVSPTDKARFFRLGHHMPPGKNANRGESLAAIERPAVRVAPSRAGVKSGGPLLADTSGPPHSIRGNGLHEDATGSREVLVTFVTHGGQGELHMAS
jgi:hypothetical protein